MLLDLHQNRLQKLSEEFKKEQEIIKQEFDKERSVNLLNSIYLQPNTRLPSDHCFTIWADLYKSRTGLLVRLDQPTLSLVGQGRNQSPNIKRLHLPNQFLLSFERIVKLVLKWVGGGGVVVRPLHSARDYTSAYGRCKSCTRSLVSLRAGLGPVQLLYQHQTILLLSPQTRNNLAT